MSCQGYGWINLKTLTEANSAPLRVGHIDVHYGSNIVIDDVQGR